MLQDLLMGFISVIQPINLFMLFLAVVIGFVGGAIPGISGVMLVVILLPITYGMDATPVFLLLTSIYAAAGFSGLISAILFRTPGTPEAMATVLDGYPMAQKGLAGQALGVGLLSSALGGLIGTLFLIFLTPFLAKVALNFSSAEYFALAILGLTFVASLSGGDILRGLIGVTFGLFIATIGIDILSGAQRFTFGSTQLLSGVDFVPILIGLFAVSEVLRKALEDQSAVKVITKVKTKIFEWNIFKRIWGTIARSTMLGVFVGVLPGVGATTASILSYSAEVRRSKNPEKYGTGVPEGVAAPEAANNSAAVCSMVPLLSLGIPGSATTAVILGAFILHGLQPGPTLFTYEKELVYTIFAGLLIINFLMLIFAKPFISIFARVLNIPYSILGPLIAIMCFLGTYAVRNSMFDVWIMLLFGIIGYFLEKYRFPIATIVLGVVLGAMVEEEFRRALQMAGGDYTVFFTRPISAVLLTLAILALIIPPVRRYLANRRKAQEAN